MLVRAARRKARPEAIRSKISHEQLRLPWLCPSYSASRVYRRPVSVDSVSHGTALRKRRNSKDVSSIAPRRALATAVEYRPLDEIPFEGMGAHSPTSMFGREYDGSSTDSGMKPFLEPLYLGGSLARAPKYYRMDATGVKGEIGEIQSVFNACLQVGRIERAAVILSRLTRILDEQGLMAMHNRYLRAAVELIMVKPSATASQALHKWYEMNIRSKRRPQNFETIAYMVKASLQSEPGQRERLVRRYMDQLDEDEVLQVLEAEILKPEEINSVTHIYPKYNFAVELGTESADEGVVELSTLPSVQPSMDSEELVPDVRPTGQKGLGLKSLKKALSLFAKLPGEGIDISTASLEMRKEIQSRLEQDAVESAIDRWREESTQLTKMGLNTHLQTKSLGARMWKWHVSLQALLKEELIKVDEAERSTKRTPKEQDRCVYGPFLRTIPTDKLAAVTILSCMTTLGTSGLDKGIPLSSAIMSISSGVEDESTFETIQQSQRKKLWPTSKPRLTPDAMRKAARSRGAGSVAKYASRFLDEDDVAQKLISPEWPLATKARVGAFLMSALIEVAKIPVTLQHPQTKELLTQMQPAFSHSHQYKMGRRLGVIMVNKVLGEQLRREPVHSLLAKHLPMLVEPEPWSDFDKGGYLVHPSKVMRIKTGSKDQRHYAEAAIGQGDMSPTFKGLDVLGKTSWRINQPVFDIMLKAWNTGEAIANMPAESPSFTLPAEPESSKDPLERRRWLKLVKAIENTKSGLHSQRCFQNFQLEIARALRNEVFYFPHNVDFRGRAYPIPPYLNHMGADHCRGLLEFGQGKELGETGLRWLKIHLANVYGFDKASLSEREDFATTHMESILDSALNPLDGARWWLQAEDPWQCLAACIELSDALKSPDPTRFISHLPIHQDGTCNGLQHYAALGGDLWGAQQVNLEPGDRPADVYSAVANLVKERISRDKEQGHPCAIILDGRITRKTVKQTVMTNVYGVTYVGAKAQVKKQLVAAYPDLPNDEKMNPGSLAAYITTHIFGSLSTMFKGAHDIQYWLGECASRISTSITPEQVSRLLAEWPGLTTPSRFSNVKITKEGYKPPKVEELVQFKSSVIWTNPLHMPVVQPYRNCKAKCVHTNMQRLNLAEPHRSDPVNKRKQLQAFPPNFVHSLDATHMLLSALRCDELGLSFAAVHDSFWTHASDVGTMNTVLRDAFIRIHSEDVVGRLSIEFAARHKGSMRSAKVYTSYKAWKPIMEWRKKNKANKVIKGRARFLYLDELVLESERQRLLQSSNPAEVQKGKEMVTPASIYESYSADGNIETVDGLSGLGDLSPNSSSNQSIGTEDSDDVIGEPLDTESVMGESDIEAESASDHEETKKSESQADENEDEEMSNFEANLKKRGGGKCKLGFDTNIWVPLTFPPVPKKGDFDVSRLRESKYFFS